MLTEGIDLSGLGPAHLALLLSLDSVRQRTERIMALRDRLDRPGYGLGETWRAGMRGYYDRVLRELLVDMEALQEMLDQTPVNE